MHTPYLPPPHCNCVKSVVSKISNFNCQQRVGKRDSNIFSCHGQKLVTSTCANNAVRASAFLPFLWLAAPCDVRFDNSTNVRPGLKQQGVKGRGWQGWCLLQLR